MTGTLIGVGVGPGDPDLVTVGAVRVLAEADRVVAPCDRSGRPGRAESVVARAVPGRHVERLVLDMATDSGARARSQTAAADRLVGWLDAGDTVAFVTLGDPNVYSSFSSLAPLVARARSEVVIKTVPGIMAFQALAARSGMVLVDNEQSLVLTTALSGTAHLESDLNDPTKTVVVYKGGGRLPEIYERLRSAGRSTDAVAGELMGLGDERVGPAARMATGPAAYLTTVVSPAQKGALP